MKPYGEDNVFILKTIEERLVPGLANKKFQQEVQANRDLPEHERIVPLLTAFKHRGKYYQIFPRAGAHSLNYIWESYSPSGVSQKGTAIAHWYSTKWLVNECCGITAALMTSHGLDGQDRLRKPPSLLHADIKSENIFCFVAPEARETKLLLKLADFGEAKRISPGVPLIANQIAHITTYRPPEHSPGMVITLNYDIWCLGCLFIDFVTWAVLGCAGIDLFREARVDEQDHPAATEVPGQLIEDVFFKRVLKFPNQMALPQVPLSGTGLDVDFETDAWPRPGTEQSTCVQVCSRVKDSVDTVGGAHTYTLTQF